MIRPSFYPEDTFIEEALYKPAMITPIVGRIVHYYPQAPYGLPGTFGDPVAALITKVDCTGVCTDSGIVGGVSTTVGLMAFFPGGNGQAALGVPYSELPLLNHWSWPKKD